jgi:plasmid stabilization system protein ParE
MYRIVYLPSAEVDLYAITTYIADDLANPKAATDLLNRYDEKLALLRDGVWIGQPLRGKLPKRISDYGYRWFSVGNYMAFFVVDEAAKLITIHHIVYGRRDLSKLL